MLFKDDRPSFGVEQEDGRIDYRARGIVRAIRSGDIIGKLHPPKAGVPGKDVYGRIIPAHEGSLLKLDLGEGVRRDAHRDEFLCRTGRHGPFPGAHTSPFQKPIA